MDIVLDPEIEQSIKDTLFKSPCISCGGFVFLINVVKVESDEIEGVILCPDCNIKNKAYFYITKENIEEL